MDFACGFIEIGVKAKTACSAVHALEMKLKMSAFLAKEI